MGGKGEVSLFGGSGTQRLSPGYPISGYSLPKLLNETDVEYLRQCNSATLDLALSSVSVNAKSHHEGSVST